MLKAMGGSGGVWIEAMVQAPLALPGTLLTVPGGATSALKVASILGRNFPLVLLLVMIGALFWPTDNTVAEQQGEGEPDALRPDALRPAEKYH